MAHNVWKEGLVAAGALALGAGVLVNSAFSPQSQLFGRTVVAGRDPAEVALTYDDGPNDAATEDLLQVLDRHGARATFFMIGRFVRQRPQLAREVLAAGHLVGNHTVTHPWLVWQSERVIRDELRACNQSLEDALGVPISYFRAPHGARRPAVLRIAHELGLTAVQWNVTAFDWEPIGPEKVLAHVRKGMERCRRRSTGANILLHDGYDRHMGADRQASIQATDRLLESFAGQGYRTIRVDAWG
jgi:peptidoglycan/xylan/chitin deacetylase (PgdA/CDA1 family)